MPTRLKHRRFWSVAAMRLRASSRIIAGDTVHDVELELELGLPSDAVRLSIYMWLLDELDRRVHIGPDVILVVEWNVVTGEVTWMYRSD